MKYWLMKSEPDVYSIQNLERDKTQGWDGVRNYQARNFMRDEMKKGDLVFFYHSNAKPAGIAGIAEVHKESHPDPTQFDPKSEYYDEKASKENPRWFQVALKHKKTLKEVITLDDLREKPVLKDMLVLRKGNRLSITPVTKKEWDTIVKIAK